MKKVLIFGLVGLMGLMCGEVKAQFDETNNLFYHAVRAPQSTQLNAAFFPTNNTWYVTFPGVNLQFGSPVAVSDFMYYDKTTQRTVLSTLMLPAQSGRLS